MALVMIRVRVPDRAGALGQVASRIGALGGDIVEVEILEHRGGGAIDEFLVDLPGAVPVGLVESELGQVDGVSVENVIPADNGGRGSALDAAVVIAQARDADGIWRSLTEHARVQLSCDWVAVVDDVSGSVLHGAGALPPPAWLLMLADAAPEIGDDDEAGGRNGAVCLPVGTTTAVLVAGRVAVAFRQREKNELVALVAVADACRRHIGSSQSVAAHPSGAADAVVRERFPA